MEPVGDMMMTVLFADRASVFRWLNKKVYCVVVLLVDILQDESVQTRIVEQERVCGEMYMYIED